MKKHPILCRQKNGRYYLSAKKQNLSIDLSGGDMTAENMANWKEGIEEIRRRYEKPLPEKPYIPDTPNRSDTPEKPHRPDRPGRQIDWER